MMDEINWVSVIQVTLSIATVVLTYSLFCVSKAQAKAAEASVEVSRALEKIEAQRDLASLPRLAIWFDGYIPDSHETSFVLYNMGTRGFPLRSLRVHPWNCEVESISLDSRPSDNFKSRLRDELLDLSIAPDVPERVRFKFSGGWGHYFEIMAQTYASDPVRLLINPAELAGYELRIEAGVLKGFIWGRPVDKDGRVAYQNN